MATHDALYEPDFQYYIATALSLHSFIEIQHALNRESFATVYDRASSCSLQPLHLIPDLSFLTSNKNEAVSFICRLCK